MGMNASPIQDKRGAIAILLAAGMGLRYSCEDDKQLSYKKHKQFALLNKKPIMSYSLETFCSCSLIDKIILMVPHGMEEESKQIIKMAGSKIADKPVTIMAGGKNRFDSVNLAIGELEATEQGDRKILIHDVARPLVSQELIAKCVIALDSYSSVVPALAINDTLGFIEKNDYKSPVINQHLTQNNVHRKVNMGSMITKTLPRSDYCLLQTPQGFRLKLLIASFSKAINIRAETDSWSDDCSVVLAYDPSTSIKVISGYKTNIKLTYRTDMKLLEFFINA